MDALAKFVADAVLGVDTLWGGDCHVRFRHGTIHRRLVVSPTSRCPLPTPSRPPRGSASPAASVDKKVDRQAVDDYLASSRSPQAIAGIRAEAKKSGGMRGEYLQGLALCLETMWDLAMEVLGKGKRRSYERCVEVLDRPPSRAVAPGS